MENDARQTVHTMNSHFHLLLCCAMAAFASVATCQAEPPADLVLTGGNIITMDEKQPTAAAVACRKGRILAVGSVEDVAARIGDDTRVIDLEGQTVVPGFIEGHGHFVSLGQSKLILDLTQAKSWNDIVELVATAAKDARPGEWITGRGWHQSKWDRPPQPNVEGYPVHQALSRAAPRNPVRLVHASGHMCIANRFAMQLAGISAETRNPRGGEILRDRQGNPTGVLRETAQSLLNEGPISRAARSEQLQRAIALASEECLRSGITSFQDAGSSLETIDVFREMATAGTLKVRLWVMIRDSNIRLRRALPECRMIGVGDHRLTVRAIKRSLDGALGSHGAWLLEPYTDMPESRGLQTISLDSLRATADLAAEHEMQLCVHAIGDRANREVLDLFEQTFKAHPQATPRRWRIEHAQHLHPRDIPRFAELKVIASMQGVHCTSDAIFVVDRLGEQRARQGAYVWQSLLKSGAVVTNGTDAPVESVAPLQSFYASVTRKLSDGRSFFPEQRMTREQALKSYTIDAAYAAFEEPIKGSLSPGKLADMVVLSKDVLTCPDEEILATRVVHTIVGGKVVYSQQSAERGKALP